MPSSNCTITVLPDVLTFVHIPRSRLQQFSHYLVKHILTPAPSFLNITCNKTDLLLFTHYSALQDFEPFARKDRQRHRKPNRSGSRHSHTGFRRSSVNADAIEVSYDTWNVLQLDSHNDRLDNAGARIRELSAILAEAGISIMYQSSYTSDFIFVKSSRLPQVLARLAQTGFVGYTFDNMPPPLLNKNAPFIPLEKEDDMLSPGLVFEHNPNLMRPFSSDAGLSNPNSLHKSYHSQSMLGEVEILEQDLVCVGLPESFTDTWSLKIIKLVAYPELIRSPFTHGVNSIRDDGSDLTRISSDGTLCANGLSRLTIPSHKEDSWIDSPVTSSSLTHVDLSPHSENEGLEIATDARSAIKGGSSPLQYSRSLPEMSSFGNHRSRHTKGSSLELVPKSVIPPHDTSVSFFSFTRTAEGSSLTTSRRHIAALFPPDERHMIICGDELDKAEDDFDPFFYCESSEDLAIMKCLQLDIQRFGDRHGIISKYSKILDSNGINHMYSSTHKTANLLVNRVDARRAAALLQSC